jgi:predicted TIM-barrel fold metal-dependent hydrolase
MLAANGSDGAIAFPNLGLLWEQELQHDVESLSANMQAHNTWILELLPACAGRLHPVALLHLRDPGWFEHEIRRIAAGGIRLAMLAAQPIDGRALAHADFDRAWALFQDLGVCVCFHVASIEPPLHAAWYALDPQPGNKLLDMVFLYLSPAVALTSLIAHGKLEQFPQLRFAVTELSAGWVPGWLLHLDGASAFYAAQTGASLARLPLRPSEYFRRQVRVQAFALEGAARLAGLTGANVFAWGSDYPHAEGMPRPSWEEYRRVQPCELAAPDLDALAGGNAAFLIGDAG